MILDTLIQQATQARERIGGQTEVIVSFRVNGNEDQRSIDDTDFFRAPNDPKHPWYFEIQLED